MLRSILAAGAVAALLASFAAPVAAKDFGQIFVDGETFRTFGTPAAVDPGTGTDPLYEFLNSTNPDQQSVAQFGPGDGSHGGRWQIYEVSFTDMGEASQLVTSYDQLVALADAGAVTITRNEAADFRCPLLPNT